MSFNDYKNRIDEGDTVILYLTINQIYNLKAESKVINKKGNFVENIFQTPYGALKCSELIGKQFGTKITLSKGWGYILQPTPELWTITLPHRTQIIYTPDISMIILQLELTPGSIVIESGTGSGSLSHALIRSVKPHGHLFTFDFHESRCKTATEEFENHGLSDFVTVTHRDVCENGFGEDLIHKADAVFLDLPHPWFAIPHAIKSIKETGGRICSFSPCIEQVQKSCEVMKHVGLQEIHTTEVLQTQYAIQPRVLPVIDLEFLKSEKDGSENEKSNKKEKSIKTITALPPTSLPGHTGYLTFATVLPIWARHLKLDVDDENNGTQF